MKAPTAPPAAGVVSAVLLQPDTMTITAGGTGAFQAQVSGSGTVALAGVTWSVTGPAVIDPGGVVRGVAGGTAQVIAAAGSKADTSIVTVLPVYLDFEAYPSGSFACGDCDLTTQFSARGVNFTYFAPSVGVGYIPPRLKQTQFQDPPDALGGAFGNHSVTMGEFLGFSRSGRLEMSLPTNPRNVVLTLRGQTTLDSLSFLVTPFPVGTVAVINDRFYAASGCITCVYLERVVQVTNPAGLTRVDVGSDQGVAVPRVDDLLIGP